MAENSEPKITNWLPWCNKNSQAKDDEADQIYLTTRGKVDNFDKH
jgi:hypothetical protein